MFLCHPREVRLWCDQNCCEGRPLASLYSPFPANTVALGLERSERRRDLVLNQQCPAETAQIAMYNEKIGLTMLGTYRPSKAEKLTHVRRGPCPLQKPGAERLTAFNLFGEDEVQVAFAYVHKGNLTGIFVHARKSRSKHINIRRVRRMRGSGQCASHIA